MKFVLLVLAALVATPAFAQNANKTPPSVSNASSDATALSVGEIAAFSLVNAESYQMQEDPNYVPPKPQIQEKVTQPGIVLFRNPDGTDRLEMDWTVGQHARSLMEQLRISMWRYQAGKANPAGLIGVNQAADAWPKLRVIYCREYPGGRYIDLQGQIQYCDEPKAGGPDRRRQ
jgi:hypothetical protein